jgi:hypothetical protein
MLSLQAKRFISQRYMTQDTPYTLHEMKHDSNHVNI